VTKKLSGGALYVFVAPLRHQMERQVHTGLFHCIFSLGNMPSYINKTSAEQGYESGQVQSKSGKPELTLRRKKIRKNHPHTVDLRKKRRSEGWIQRSLITHPVVHTTVFHGHQP
jgi:hypothetical protein